ncbi:MAG: fluoride efflux transporter FluC, partial [Actinomycetes bacterium]
AGGVLGSLGRFGIAELLGTSDVDHVPWATLLVNVVGCLAIGTLVPVLDRGGRPWLRPFLVTGVLGGFTTVSALALEAGLLVDTGRWLGAATYLAVTLAVGLAAVRVGTRLVRRPG